MYNSVGIDYTDDATEAKRNAFQMYCYKLRNDLFKYNGVSYVYTNNYFQFLRLIEGWNGNIHGWVYKPLIKEKIK